MTTNAPMLRMTGISKRFPGVQALEQVSFDADRGEVVALVGVNGAGKSTLMNVLGGVYAADQGEIQINGSKAPLKSPRDAEACGISFIHQELLFFASQTVAENIFIARLFKSTILPFLVSRSRANREAKRFLHLLGSDISPTAKMEDLSVGERQIVEIARALATGSELVIFDEPTSSLSLREKEVLFRVIRKLKADGRAIIYITHFLDEVLELCDKFVVLRNGKVHGAGQIQDVTKSDIIRMIIGKDINYEEKVARTIADRPALRIDNIKSGSLLNDISFQLNEGEILGIWGLMGSGRTELVRAILGLDSIDGGATYIFDNGAPRPISPRKLLQHCGYVTESRHADGLFLSQPVWKNISVTTLESFAAGFFGFLDRKKEVETSIRYIDMLKIATPGPETLVQGLSGGNQQKVVFAKWLNRTPRILVMDEPTRGVDVGAKLEIGNLIKELARGGTAILLITSEVEEMVSLSDRVLVLRDGGIVADLKGDAVTHRSLMGTSLGGETLQ